MFDWQVSILEDDEELIAVRVTDLVEILEKVEA
jgi:hypothetical protein